MCMKYAGIIISAVLFGFALWTGAAAERTVDKLEFPPLEEIETPPIEKITLENDLVVYLLEADGTQIHSWIPQSGWTYVTRPIDNGHLLLAGTGAAGRGVSNGDAIGSRGIW